MILHCVRLAKRPDNLGYELPDEARVVSVETVEEPGRRHIYVWYVLEELDHAR